MRVERVLIVMLLLGLGLLGAYFGVAAQDRKVAPPPPIVPPDVQASMQYTPAPPRQTELAQVATELPRELPPPIEPGQTPAPIQFVPSAPSGVIPAKAEVPVAPVAAEKIEPQIINIPLAPLGPRVVPQTVTPQVVNTPEPKTVPVETNFAAEIPPLPPPNPPVPAKNESPPPPVSPNAPPVAPPSSSSVAPPPPSFPTQTPKQSEPAPVPLAPPVAPSPPVVANEPAPNESTFAIPAPKPRETSVIEEPTAPAPPSFPVPPAPPTTLKASVNVPPPSRDLVPLPAVSAPPTGGPRVPKVPNFPTPQEVFSTSVPNPELNPEPSQVAKESVAAPVPPAPPPLPPPAPVPSVNAPAPPMPSPKKFEMPSFAEAIGPTPPPPAPIPTPMPPKPSEVAVPRKVEIAAPAMAPLPEVEEPKAASQPVAAPPVAIPQAIAPNLAAPKLVELPVVHNTPAVSPPQVAPPQAASPQAASPQAASPQVAVPQIESPKKVDLPLVQDVPMVMPPLPPVTKVDVPKVEVPKAEAPKADAHKVAMPPIAVEVAPPPPAIVTPPIPKPPIAVEVAPLSVPVVQPKAETPKVAAPVVPSKTQELAKPEMVVPQIPQVVIPKYDAPKVETPKVETPKLVMPAPVEIVDTTPSPPSSQQKVLKMTPRVDDVEPIQKNEPAPKPRPFQVIVQPSVPEPVTPQPLPEAPAHPVEPHRPGLIPIKTISPTKTTSEPTNGRPPEIKRFLPPNANPKPTSPQTPAAVQAQPMSLPKKADTMKPIPSDPIQPIVPPVEVIKPEVIKPEVIRPEPKTKPIEPELEGPSLAGLPQVMVEKMGPNQTKQPGRWTYTLMLKNTGGGPAHQVRLDDELPPGCRLVGANPQPGVDGPRVGWIIPMLPAGAEKAFVLEVLGNPNPDAPSKTNITMAPPKDIPQPSKVRKTGAPLVLDLKMPSQANLGQPLIAEVLLTNATSQMINDLSLHVDLSQGLNHPMGQSIEAPIANLAPGTTKSIKLHLSSKQRGSQSVEVTVSNPAGIEVNALGTVQVVGGGGLHIQPKQIGQLYLDQPSEVRIEVANHHPHAVRNLTVVDVLPEGVEYVGASDLGLYRPETRSVHWLLDGLAPGQTHTLLVRVEAKRAGSHQHEMTLKPETGPEVKASGILRVEGFADLSIKMSAKSEHLEMNRETVVQVRVANQGSVPATNVQLVATLPEGMKPGQFAQGPTSYQTTGRQISFGVLPRLGPQSQVVYTIGIVPQAAGDRAFRVQVSADQYAQPLMRELRVQVLPE